MVSVRRIWLGKVDRISGSNNAIVRGDDIFAPDDRPSPSAVGEVNLGPLPNDVVGEVVVFAYAGGHTYGICLDSEWTSSEYIKKMETKSGIDTSEFEFPTVTEIVDVPESVDKGDTLIAENIDPTTNRSFRLDVGDGSLLVSLTGTDDTNWSALGVIRDPVVSISLPIPVRVTEVHETHIEAELSFKKSDLELPDIGEVVTTTVVEFIEEGTVAYYESDYNIPVLIPGAEYPTDERLDVQITAHNTSHLTGKVPLGENEFDTVTLENQNEDLNKKISQRVIVNRTPIDIRSVPEGAPDTAEIVVTDVGETAHVGRWNIRGVIDDINIAEGDTVHLEVEAVKQTAFIGYHQDFPIRCECAGTLPSELENEEIQVKIQSVAIDKATAVPASPDEVETAIKARIVGTTVGDAAAVMDNYLLRIPEVDVVSAGDVISVGIDTDTKAEATGSISRHPVFEESDETLVRLPETDGRVVHVDGIPVTVDHLPNVTSPVTLGIEEAHHDYVVPAVSALPASHTPDIGQSVTVVPEHVAGDVVVGVGAELPTELPLLPVVEAETVETHIVKVQREAIFTVVRNVGGEDGEQLTQCYEQLQSARIEYQAGNYKRCTGILTEAREHLSEGAFILDALIIAAQALIQAISEIKAQDKIVEAANSIEEYQTQIDDNINQANISTDTKTLLAAYQAQLNAARQCLTALDKVDQDVKSKYQAIARGATATEQIKNAIASIKEARELVAETRFDRQIVMSEGNSLINQLQHEFPYPVDELERFETTETDRDWFHLLISQTTENPVDSDRENKIDAEETWQRPPTPNEIGIFSFIGGEYNAYPTTDDNGSVAEDASEGAEGTNVESLSELPELTSTDRSKSEGQQQRIPDDTKQPVGVNQAASENAREEEAVNTAESTTVDRTQQSPMQDEESVKEKTGTESGSVSSPEIESQEDSNATSEQKPRVQSIPDREDTAELKRLRKEAEEAATENPRRENVEYTASPYNRSEAIRQYALERANGICEVCNKKAPFEKPDGTPYLEVHHVEELGEGGADHPALVAALCPTCHKRIHHGRFGDDLNEQLRQKLEEGLGEVGTTE